VLVVTLKGALSAKAPSQPIGYLSNALISA